MHLHNDEPTLLDQLHRLALVQRVGDDIAQCEPPHVFGVHGDWGAGKTSFLHQLQAYLTGACPQQPEPAAKLAKKKGLPLGVHKDHVTVVWFEAWRYQHERAPIIALLQEIRTQLPWYSKALAQTRKLGEVAIRSALLAFEDLTKKIGIQASKIQEAGETWEKENLAAALPSHMVRQHLEHALKVLLGEKEGAPADEPRPRLVVMVDDLDRCESDAAYKLIEGIKIYLNLPNCVFVLGMNQRIIEEAIARHLPKSDDLALRALRAREYLDKLCQNIVHLPFPRRPVDLLKGLLPGLPTADGIYTVLESHGCLPRNPRKIKAFANFLRGYVPRFSADLAMGGQRAQDCAHLIVIFSCLYQFHPEVYRILETHPLFYLEIRGWAKLDGTITKHAVFSTLGQSEVAGKSDPSTPTAEPLRVNAFADPAEGNVFRVQGLIASFRPVTRTEIEFYLV
jgi:KAP family P-loop domain